jgi:hypothetical protein
MYPSFRLAKGGRSVSFLWTTSLCLLAIASLTSMSAGQTYCPDAGNGSDVLTWHNDTNRTGWQCNEATLSQSNVYTTTSNNNFGLMAQWPVSGSVYAQPLAVAIPFCGLICAPPYIIVATEEDMLYAFSPPTSTQPSGAEVWSVNLASLLNTGATTYTAVSCNNTDEPPPCGAPILPYESYIGVTGTPVIDPSTGTIYIVAAVENNSQVVSYYLFAIGYASGSWILQAAPMQITSPSTGVAGHMPTGSQGKCQNPPVYTNTGISFLPGKSLQRQALLLEPNPNGQNWVYVTFSDYPEQYMDNGWIFAYYMNNQPSGGYPNTLIRELAAAPTAYGGEGGVWGSGAGPAADATSGAGTPNGIYLAVANGPFDVYLGDAPNGTPYQDYGDSLIRLSPSNGYWPPLQNDYYTPGNAFTYGSPTLNNNCPSSPSPPGLCWCDEDFGSGGVMVVPSGYTYTCNPNTNSCGSVNPNQCASGCNVVISADKQSNIYVENQANLSGYTSNVNNNIELVTTPTPTRDGYQGYWASPAYWYDGANNWIFYSATDSTQGKNPIPLWGYQLATTGPAGNGNNSSPVPQNGQTGTAQSWNTYTGFREGVGAVGFCDKTPTPTVSSGFNSNGTVDTASGIVWVIENPDSNNYPGANPYNCTAPIAKARLHAICATTSGASSYCNNTSGELIELYNSNDNVNNTDVGAYVPYSTPTVFNGYVYVGTETYVNVFGLCPGGKCGLD